MAKLIQIFAGAISIPARPQSARRLPAEPGPFRRSFLVLICLAFSWAAFGGATEPAPPLNPALADWQAGLESFLAQPRFTAAAWGIKVISLDSGQTLFERNSDKLLKPASNVKLYTAALVLDRFGPDYQIATSLHAPAPPDANGRLAGPLLVYGRGDPSMAARFNDGDYSQSLAPIVSALANAGVKKIEGDLIGDESFFAATRFGPGWTWQDLQHHYGAAASSLTVEDNVIDLLILPDRMGRPCAILPRPGILFLTFVNRTETVPASTRRWIQIERPVGQSTVYVSGQLPLEDAGWTGAVTVHDPALWFVTLLKAELIRHGITVTGVPRVLPAEHEQGRPELASEHWIELDSVQSRPLDEIVARMMKPSQNLYAHLLLLQAGARSRHVNPDHPSGRPLTTAELGLAELDRFLERAGISRDDVLIEEGSGLSRNALLTPNATVRLLQFMNEHPHAKAFRASLPTAGVDGTLRNRLKGTPAENNLQAKTGGLRYVFTLAGYVTSAAGEPLAFAIMLNNYNPPSGSSGRDAVDAVALLLAELGMRARVEKVEP